MEKGILYLVATPIGNLSDMTPRGIEILKSVDLIAAEDTRNSIKLLNHFDIHTKMTAYHEFNRFDKADDLVRQILDGKSVACITDAGTPGISDPGEVLAQKCIEVGITVTSVPGASACINALVISGLSTRRFRFEAFLPPDKKERKEILEEVKNETCTLIFYEAPHHLIKTLDDLYVVLGDRKIALCKELTKLHENVNRTTLKEAISYYKENEPKGEFVLVIEGRDKLELKQEKVQSFSEMSIEEHMELYLNQGLDKKEAMKKVAVDRNVPKREIYKALLNEE